MTDASDHAPEQIGHLLNTPDLADALDSDRFKQFLDHVPVAIAVSELLPSEAITYANLEFERLTGRPAGEMVGRSWRTLPGIASANGDDRRLSDAVETDHEYVGAFAIVLDEGSIEVDAWSNTIEDEDGTALFRLVALARAGRSLDDVQQAALGALRDKDVQLLELQHRVKNNLQMISSLIILQARKIDDKSIRDALHSMLERVQALSTVHQRLYQSDDISRFDVAELAHDLSGDLVGACGRDDIKVTVNADHVFIRAPKAAPLALVINELITNAIKHAFRDQGGHLRVTVQRLPTQCHIRIEDDGAGLSGKNDSDSFGTTIVRTLARQIGATVSWTPADPGARVDVVFPLDSHELAEATG